jgi:hypothetical protein
MTLVIALKWLWEEGEGVVISSDSRATAGEIAYEVRKIYPIYVIHNGEEVDLGVAGGAGYSSLVKQGYGIAESVLKDYSRQVGFRNLTFEEFGKAVQDIEDKLIHRFSSLRREGIEPIFEMILASVDPKGKASIYMFDSKGLAEPVHDNPGFAIIGCGAVTGGVLLTRLLGYSMESSSEYDLGMLSAFVIDIVSEVDPAVGPFLGESAFIRVDKGEVTMGPLKEEALKEYKKRIKKRKELIMLMQKLCDIKEIGEDGVEAKLKELLQPKRKTREAGHERDMH